MWLLLLISVLNASLANKGFVLNYRLNLGGLPINVLDGLLVLASVFMFVNRRGRYPTDRVHPLLVWSVGLFVPALCAGLIGALALNSKTYLIALEARNLVTMPLCMMIGYMLLKVPDSGRRFAYVHVLSGIGAAALTSYYFLVSASELSTSKQIDAIRTIEFISYYAGLAAAFLIFTHLAKLPLMPAPLTFAVVAFCAFGQCATLTRSDWLAFFAATTMVLVFLLPGQRLAPRLAKASLVGVLLIGALIAGAWVASRVSNRNVIESLSARFKSLNPTRGDDASSYIKAWDTRVPGALRELEEWSKSPLTGQGFGYTDAKGLLSEDVAFGHNAWTSALASTGITGFFAFAVPIIGVIVVGRRMVRDRYDRNSVLVGAIGATTGAYAIIIGVCTMSFNVERGAICIGLLIGVTLRARAMQLTMSRQGVGQPEYFAEDPVDY